MLSPRFWRFAPAASSRARTPSLRGSRYSTSLLSHPGGVLLADVIAAAADRFADLFGSAGDHLPDACWVELPRASGEVRPPLGLKATADGRRRQPLPGQAVDEGVAVGRPRRPTGPRATVRALQRAEALVAPGQFGEPLAADRALVGTHRVGLARAGAGAELPPAVAQRRREPLATLGPGADKPCAPLPSEADAAPRAVPAATLDEPRRCHGHRISATVPSTRAILSDPPSSVSTIARAGLRQPRPLRFTAAEPTNSATDRAGERDGGLAARLVVVVARAVTLLRRAAGERLATPCESAGARVVLRPRLVVPGVRAAGRAERFRLPAEDRLTARAAWLGGCQTARRCGLGDQAPPVRVGAPGRAEPLLVASREGLTALETGSRRRLDPHLLDCTQHRDSRLVKLSRYGQGKTPALRLSRRLLLLLPTASTDAATSPPACTPPCEVAS